MTWRGHTAAVAVTATIVVAAFAFAFAAAPAGAARAHAGRVCAPRTTVMSTPNGLSIGFLTRGTPLVVMRHTSNRVWADVHAVHSVFGWIAGWIRTRDIC